MMHTGMYMTNTDERVCTGVAATYCPIHGECVCPPVSDPDPYEHERDLNSPFCPLHSPESAHAEGGADRPPWARS